MMNAKKKIMAVFGFAGMASASVFAAAVDFIGPEGGDWAAAENWDSGALPTSADYATLNSWAVLNSAVSNNILAFRLGNTGDAVLDIGEGAELLANTNTIWGSWLGNASGYTGTVNQVGGSVLVNELEVGSQSGAYGYYNLSGGDVSVSGALYGYSLYVGGTKLSDQKSKDGGTGVMSISGGALMTKSGVALGHSSFAGTGTFSVQGSGIDEISIGGYTNGAGSWAQYQGSTLALGIDAGGITPITITGGDVLFDYGSTVDVSFVEGVAEETGRWTVMTTDGSMTDNGMFMADGVDASVWNFGVTNGNELWVSYGMGGWEAPTTPPAVDGVYAWPTSPQTVDVYWDENAAADSYIVKRSTESGTNYVTVATDITDLFYVDSTVLSNETYYYVVTAVNDTGEGLDSDEYTAVVLPYTIIGTDDVWDAADPTQYKYSLFDGDVDTYFDGQGTTAWAGLDFGEGNAQQIVEVRYVLRNSANAYAGSLTAEIQGANAEDFSDAVTLHTFDSNSVTYAEVNVVEIEDAGAYRYVRVTAGARNSLNYLSELNFVLTSDFTSNGTSKYWLDDYGLVTDGDYEAADMEDADGDSLLNWEEYVAGTDPTDAASVLAMNTIVVGEGEVVITWQSVEGKSYSVNTNAGLSLGSFAPAATGIVATSNETSYTISGTGSATVFYEVELETE